MEFLGTRPPHFLSCPKWPQRGMYLNAKNASYRLPAPYENSDPNAGDTCRNTTFGFDKVASAALNHFRDSYQPMTTAGTHEFAAFFSVDNMQYLRAIIERKVKTKIDEGLLFEKMSFAYSMKPPRQDVMDVERRLVFTPKVTQSYVNELNAYVIENILPEIVEGEKLRDFYLKNRNFPSELPDEQIVDNRAGISSTQALDYWMPI